MFQSIFGASIRLGLFASIGFSRSGWAAQSPWISHLPIVGFLLQLPKCFARFLPCVACVETGRQPGDLVGRWVHVQGRYHYQVCVESEWMQLI
ncbi:hypothetical protein B0T22DRAFT_467274 [Podospora appendiculata]|uniref:Secreted protein n=1 Tax=Podospora appendiculata TaxID=314037 RepID=A0AAE1CAY4_9PEZI|nr:hypothetical protein B0T22DRAFT_467274 [Podospora appendiculata]